ncbi:MAG: tRNA (guanosine(37)-N1)-methyltransferase TrmD [Candidatus Doudnabacteria bacterium]|nr:tRNA (guanosine(37)-N1)-methyltransferase TrmD [Candidatus Doudnabacteria bacterium]
MKKPKKLSVKVITLFPQFIENFVESFGILKRAIKLKLLDFKPVYLRQFGLGERQVVDDRPYGGGVGMVLRADVLYKAILSIKKKELRIKQKTRIILLTPQGKQFKQADAHRLSKYDSLIFVCGRYEGFDERVRGFVDEELSIGDYILMGGELPALVISEAVMRLRPGILGKDESTVAESFSENLLEYPQYTKPETLRIKNNESRIKVLKVPKVLLTGHHKNIEQWRKDESIKRTKKRRPDLLIDQN